MARIIVGMSGGVDSAVAAYLLKQAGHEVIGVTLRTWDGQENRCCEIDDARQSADTMGIEYHVFNCVSDFENRVVKAFTEDYLRGLTPNPCVICNREVKWERLLFYANVLKADYVATGHYARVTRLENGRYTVRKAGEKDQTYMLYRLTQEQLARTLMPLGEYSKAEVRQIAQEAGLRVASKPDSQEICFVTDGSYADFIKERVGDRMPGEGNFVDGSGRVLGVHKGIVHYTVGQRKRLGVALGRPAYIKKIIPERGEIVLGTSDDIRCLGVTCRDLAFMGMPGPGTGAKFRCQVKVRYRHPGQSAAAEMTGEDTVSIRFDEPVRSAAPGQSAVFYDDDGCLLGGGVISDVLFDE